MDFPKFNLLVVCMSGWLTQHQNGVIKFLLEENRTLHELLGEERPKLNGLQRKLEKFKDYAYRVPSGISGLKHDQEAECTNSKIVNLDHYRGKSPYNGLLQTQIVA